VAGSALGNRYLFQGREFSWASGLCYFRARWYDPVSGRWLSPDPIGIAGGLNQYAFCGNDPVNATDPSGLVLYEAWQRIANQACIEGGLWGMTQANFGWSVIGLLDMLGGRGVQSTAGKSGWYAGKGQGAKAAYYGALTVGQVALSASGSAGMARGARSLCAARAASRPPIIIGENMQRVKAYAEKVGGQAYRPWRMDPWNPATAMRRNARWIRQQIRQGREIVDIGPDFGRRSATGHVSDFYQMERRSVKGYQQYRKAFTRSGKEGGVPGFDF
jgi:RHS repeat-associated protein